jgi:polyisoprenoid-binding protein YceI
LRLGRRAALIENRNKEEIMRRLAFALMIAVFACPTARAAETFKIDKDHTNIVFLVDHLGYSKMVGRFTDFEGQFTFDESSLEANKVTVTIKAESVDTNHKARDDHLRSVDFFNAKEFPTMTFVSTRVERTGEKTGKLHGNVTLLGVTKQVVLDVTFNKRAEHPLPRYNKVMTAGFSARGSIKRSDFGMKFALGGVGDEIQLIIEVEGAKV